MAYFTAPAYYDIIREHPAGCKPSGGMFVLHRPEWNGDRLCRFYIQAKSQCRLETGNGGGTKVQSVCRYRHTANHGFRTNIRKKIVNENRLCYNL